MHELDDPRDTDPDYILGPFDARRMIRLEGMPSNLARQQSQAYVSAQTKFPSFDRNVSYVTLAVGRSLAVKDAPYASNGGWAFGLNRRSSGGTGLSTAGLRAAIRLRGEHYGSAALFEASVRRQNEIYENLRELRTSLYADTLLKGPDVIDRIPHGDVLLHEHGHSLFSELELADRELDTQHLSQLESAIRSVIPSYVGYAHNIPVDLNNAEKLARLPLMRAFAHQGIGSAGWANMDELTAEAFRLASCGNSSPLIDAVSNALNEMCALQSDIRIARQERLFEHCKHALPLWSCYGHDLQLDDSLLVEANGDARFVLVTERDRRFALGRSQIARLDAKALSAISTEMQELSRVMAGQLGLSSIDADLSMAWNGPEL